MATINKDQNNGYELIEEKISQLTNDLNTMVERKEISTEAATHIFTELKNIAFICKDCVVEEDKTNTHKISF